MEKNDEKDTGYYTLESRSDFVDYVIKQGYGNLLTNLKQHKECKECIANGAQKCPVCLCTYGVYLYGFKNKDKINELRYKYFNELGKGKKK